MKPKKAVLEALSPVTPVMMMTRIVGVGWRNVRLTSCPEITSLSSRALRDHDRIELIFRKEKKEMEGI